jgi:nitroimidazol reductase NimA-like FMN-containing flavoprotein (pyridoxamine 5'-phosphate oxidase superfamily)
VPGFDEIARTILDTNRYMTLATADSDGRPWATPVYFTPHEYRELYWISSPAARHSRNIATRSDVGIAVFDSTVEVGGAAAVYVEATAGEVPDAELAEAAAVAFPPRFPGIVPFAPGELRDPSPVRLYRASITAAWILKPRFARSDGEIDSRVPVTFAL